MKNSKLNKEEVRILEDFETGKFKSIKDIKKEEKQYQKYAKYTLSKPLPNIYKLPSAPIF